jgi:hypothetical protein
MTLLLSLLSSRHIFQSSDYRLIGFQNGIAVPEEDVAGAKQLSVHSHGLVAQISFTGVARVKQLKTRDWLRDILKEVAHPIDIDSLALEISCRGANAIKGLPLNLKMLTVAIAVVQTDRKPWLILVSNIDRLDGPRRSLPLDTLEISSLTASQPKLFALGYDVGVNKNDRSYLEHLTRSNPEIQPVMAGLNLVNVRAAKNPKSKGFISEGCLISCLKASGDTSSRNFGAVKGIPDDFLGKFNMGELLRKGFPRNDIALVQSASASTAHTRELLPEGKPRTLEYSNPSMSVTGIGNVSGGEFDKLTIQGLSGSVSLRKNQEVSVVLAKIHFEAGPTGPAPRYESEIPLFAKYSIQNALTLDSVPLRDLKFHFDIVVNEELHILQIRQSSVGLRSLHYPTPFRILGPTEEFAMSAPKNGITLTARSGGPPVTGTLEASFMLRDFPETSAPDKRR